MSKGKPVLFPDSRTDVEKFDPRKFRETPDPGRVPGWSEIVQANDIAKADDLTFREAHRGADPKARTKDDWYRIIGAHPQALPVEFRWLRITGSAGEGSTTVARDLDRAVNQEGFRLASKDDLDAHGYGFPPTARLAEDGTIRRGPDVALYIRSGEVARMWDKFMADEAARAEGALPQAFQDGGYDAETFEEAERDTAEIRH